MSPQLSKTKDELSSKALATNTKLYMLLLFVFLALFLFVPGLIIVISVGILPTLGAKLSEPTSTNAQTYCVGFCNFAGLIPSVHDLFKEHFSITAAYEIIHNEYHLLFILGSSAIGWAAFFIIPSITVSVYRSRDKMNLVKMIQRYDELKGIWGGAIPDSEIIANSKNKKNSS